MAIDTAVRDEFLGLGSKTEIGVPPATALLTGRLLSVGRNDPIAGVTLVGRMAVPANGNDHSIDVATGTTDVDGTFTVSLLESLPDWVAAALHCADGPPLAVYADHGGQLTEVGSVALAAGASVAFEYPVESGAVDWSGIASLASEHKLNRVNQLAAAVADAAMVPDVFARLRARAQLEAAFLDPAGVLDRVVPLPAWRTLVGGGLADYEDRLLARAGQNDEELRASLAELRIRLTSFDDLSQVDWPFDVDKLYEGAISDAINITADVFKKTANSIWLPWAEPNPLVGYRDYLLSVWATIGAFDPPASPTPLTPDQARQQLGNRFHQDFTTTDTKKAPANELLIPIVLRILGDPAPTGYGLPVTDIPARPPDQSARAYLDALIEKTGETAIELGLRFRLDLTRSDAEVSSPVHENIATIQGLFRDSFQSEPDPFHTPPDVRNDTIIPRWLRGRAPFFLEYDEWVAKTAVFYPENNFSTVRLLSPDQLARSARSIIPSNYWHPWAQKVAVVFDEMQKALKWMSAGEYQLALDLLDKTRTEAMALIKQRGNGGGGLPGYQLRPPMQARQRYSITDKQSLLKFERYLGYKHTYDNPYSYDFPVSSAYIDPLAAGMVLYVGYVYWVWRSDILLALGHFPEAAASLNSIVEGYVGVADLDDPAGYEIGLSHFLYRTGSLPYTFDRIDPPVGPSQAGDPIPYPGTAPLLHRVDTRFLQLRLGNVLLEWADSLYRADDQSLTARARELYKAVLWLHDEDPGISPTWPENHANDPLAPPFGYWSMQRNPAVVSQTSRARLGLTQIDAGLNYFGATDDMVPVQRYRTLKDQADRFAALAKAAERDFLVAVANLEQLSIDQMRNSNLLSKARAQQNIAQEQRKIADYNVAVAKQQVAEVQAQIDAKKAEIAEHDSFLGQWSDFLSGAVKTVTSALKDLKDTPAGDVSGQITAGIKAEMGLSGAKSAGLLGLGTGASVLAGYGLFVYVGYSTLSSMASAARTREAELKRLQEVTLPLAQGNVTAREREVTIAQLQAAVAAADIELASSLIYFNNARLLNAEFWMSIIRVLQRVLRRYLDLGAWSAWLAERALAFDQNRSLRIVRMDYLVRSLQNVTGGDLLQGDLAELEAARISGERSLVPFTYTLSLVEEFPLAFGALKAHGACIFSTSEAALRNFFPGTYGHRIRNVKVAVRTTPAGLRVRGTLTNHGSSAASIDEKLKTRNLMRFPDAIAISETHSAGPTDPRLIEVLGPFEGSGIDTTWTLQLDSSASGGGWDAITDIVIEVEGLARYAEGLRQARSLAAATPAPANRVIMMSARTFAKNALAAVKSAGSGNVTLDFREFPFPVGEHNRMVSNVAVLLPGAKGQPVNAHLHLAAPASVDTDFTIKDGIALSNGKPLRLPGSTTPDSPLNDAIGVAVDQPWIIQIKPSAGADLSGLVDLVIAIDYGANLPNLPTLSEGAKGPDVRWAQYLLVRRTMTYDQIDGKFGPVTKLAVQRFQRDNGLVDDGMIDPPTWFALDGDRPRPPKLAFDSDGEVVRKLQVALNQGRGTFAPSSNPTLATDGKFGKNTEDVVKATQAHNHIADDGVVFLQTWAIPTGTGSEVLGDLCGVPGPGKG